MADKSQTTITVAPPSPSVLDGLRWSLDAAASEFGEGSYDREAREWLDKVEEACKRG